jgi:hypothetical protein
MIAGKTDHGHKLRKAQDDEIALPVVHVPPRYCWMLTDMGIEGEGQELSPSTVLHQVIAGKNQEVAFAEGPPSESRLQAR